VRLLAEDLILFRDESGRPGLVAQTCCHRGANLFYGRVEGEGLRCCYHGWKFDVKGNCLDQPMEPGGGTRREVARQPWYPVQERYGVVWAYMGPPEKKPLLPRWKHLENLDDSIEEIQVRVEPGWGTEEGMPFNHMQLYDNDMDVYHFPWVHYLHSGPQFFFEGIKGLDGHALLASLQATVRYEETKWGVAHHSHGNGIMNSVECIFPSSVSVPGFNDMMFHVPVDDNNTRMIQLYRVPKGTVTSERVIIHGGKKWKDCTPEDLQKYPGDMEAIQDIPGAGNTWEHLATTDRGVILMRRVWEREVDKVMRGEDPIGVCFGPGEDLRETIAGFHPMAKAD